MAHRPVRAYVAWSPHGDEPFSDGDSGPFHGASAEAPEALPDQDGTRRRISYPGFPHVAEAPAPGQRTAAIEGPGEVVQHFGAARFMSGEEHDPIPEWTGGRPLFHGTRSILHPGEVLTPEEAERHPSHPVAGMSGHVHVTPEGDEAQYWAEHGSSAETHRRMLELGREREVPGRGYTQDHAYPPRVYEVEPTGPLEPDPMGEGSSYRTSHPVRVMREVRPLQCYHEDHEGAMHWPDHPHWQFLRDEQDAEDDDGEEAEWDDEAGDWRPHEGAREVTASSDGDYYVRCDQGHDHWGGNGAAGLLIRHRADDGETRYLLQHRSPHVQHGGTWSTPGGAIGSGESPERAAMREATEELGELPPDLTHHHTVTDDHGGWKYHTVVMDSPRQFHPGGDGEDDWESEGHGWFTPAEMRGLPLHPGFAASWDKVRKSGALQDGPHQLSSREERGDRWWNYQNRYMPDTVHRGIHVRLPEDLHEYVHDESEPREERARALESHFRERGLGMHWTPHVNIAHRAAMNAADEHPFEDDEDPEYNIDDWMEDHDWHGDDDEGDEGHEEPRATHTDVIFHAQRPGERNRLRNPGELEAHEVGWKYSRDEDELPLKPGSPVRMTGISWKEHEPEYPNEPYEHVDFPRPVRHVSSRRPAGVLPVAPSAAGGGLVLASHVTDQVAASPALPSAAPALARTAPWQPETAEEAVQAVRDLSLLFQAVHDGLSALAARMDERPVTEHVPGLLRSMAQACATAAEDAAGIVAQLPPEGSWEGPQTPGDPKV